MTVTLSVVESTQAPATAPATQGSTQPAIPAAPAMGPDQGKITTYTLKLYKQETPSTAPAAGTQPAAAAVSWKAVYEGQSPAWTFQPNAALVDHLTKESYAAPATQPATAPAPAGGLAIPH